MKLVLCLTVAATMHAQPATLVYKTNPDRDLKISLTTQPGETTDRRTAVVFFYNGGWGTGILKSSSMSRRCTSTSGARCGARRLSGQN
jgi:hypothetical protein